MNTLFNLLDFAECIMVKFDLVLVLFEAWIMRNKKVNFDYIDTNHTRLNMQMSNIEVIITKTLRK